SRAQTSTGEQVLAMRTGGAYGKIVGVGGVGVIQDNPDHITAKGNPYKSVEVSEKKGGTLFNADGYPVMIQDNPATYHVASADDDDDDDDDDGGGGCSLSSLGGAWNCATGGAKKVAKGGVNLLRASPVGAGVEYFTTGNTIYHDAAGGATSAVTGAV